MIPLLLMRQSVSLEKAAALQERVAIRCFFACSAHVVFPWSTWARMQMFRMCSG